MIGALNAIGQEEKARKIKRVLALARWEVKPENPFPGGGAALISPRTAVRNPYAGRIHTLWAAMREVVIENFPAPPERLSSNVVYFEKAAAIYKHDAYNSLSIEGYVVTPEWIEKIRDGAFNQDSEESRRKQDAMAARGYHLAHEAVMRSIRRIFEGENPGAVADRDLPTWYAQLHQPHLDSGIIPAYALAGYRERRVFIQNSLHVPPPREAVPDAMKAFFELLIAEDHPAVRGVLGHFAFVFIHPYSDGNGRIGRFLMNAMLASGGYPWTIVRVARRGAYMAALENASTQGNIVDFARFLAGEMQVDWSAAK